MNSSAFFVSCGGGQRFWLALLLAWLPLAGLAQDAETGAISGRIADSWQNSPLAGVTVLVRGTTLGTVTDSAGTFTVQKIPPGTYAVSFSRSGYGGASVGDVKVAAGQRTSVEYALRPEFYQMEIFEAVAEPLLDEKSTLLIERQQSVVMMDAIGSEQFSKLGSSDAAQIVSRVTGVSVVGGKYAVVRGLSDRYTRTLLNGVEVPSADPYKLSPQLDLFPSAMIDRITVSKTFTPDQPGGTGGGTIDIVTKSFPEKPFVKVKLENSYNPNSNLKHNFLADPGSSMNLFAMPSGPDPLRPDLFGLLAPPPRPQPQNASASETLPTAIRRGQDAANLSALLKDLGTANFAGTQQDSPLNSSFVASAGATKLLFGQKFGMFGGINYKRDFRAVDEALVRRYNPDGQATKLGVEQRGNINTDYGASVNLGYELGEHSQLGFNFMLAHSTDEEARHASYRFVEGRDDSLEQWQLHHTDREILNYQLSGRHELPFLLDSRLEWVGALANTTQSEPDHRFMNYYLSTGGQATFGDGSTPFPQFPSRYFREIAEDGINYRVDWTVPLGFMKEESKFKTGYFSSSNTRDFREQYFSYNLSDGFDPNDPNTYLNNPAYLEYIATHTTGTRTNFSFARFFSDTYSHPYTASLDVNATYFMADLGVLRWLRVIGGARLEGTRMNLDAGRDGKAKIEQTDLLPSASLVITLVTNLNLRLGYGETVSRPSYREIAPVQSYLPDLGVTALGNPELKMIAIKSYDARLEWFPEPGDVLSAGVFYKQVSRPIELVSKTLGDEQVTWQNRTNGAAQLMGVEFEARKSMEFLSPHLRGFFLGANVTLIESSTKLTEDPELINKRNSDPSAKDTRPLYDQSPYIINLDVNYEHPTSGTSLTVGANLTGPRLVLAKSQGPDIYEHPPASLDAAISQKFWKHWTFRLGVRNLLDLQSLQTYGSEADGKIFQSFKRGRTYSLSVSAEF